MGERERVKSRRLPFPLSIDLRHIHEQAKRDERCPQRCPQIRGKEAPTKLNLIRVRLRLRLRNRSRRRRRAPAVLWVGTRVSVLIDFVVTFVVSLRRETGKSSRRQETFFLLSWAK